MPGRPPGIIPVTHTRRAAKIDRIAASVMGVVACLLGTLGLLGGISGAVYHGVTFDPEASTILSVLPGSFVWNAGIRVAREIHDAPLQELAGVIKRLERTPETRAEGETLRAVADQLRSMATDLYPALLEDWGLAAAIKHEMARLAGDPAIDLIVEIEDSTGVTPDRRPPAAVALAAYRVAHEAVANAIAHSEARVVHVSGSVAPNALDITVLDDGVGITDEDRRRALDTGHFGLSSMHNRADAVGAKLELASDTEGTRVRIVWSA